jgi:shikimate dehydrogenase
MSHASIATISARTMVAGVAGRPVRHSLSPLIHNAWLAEAAVDGVYVAFSPGEHGFSTFVEGFRGGVVRGLNVTAPFKVQALAIADTASARARDAGSANVLVFDAGGGIHADNTDGEGLLAALGEQAPGYRPSAGPAVILGAGGAARGAAAALLEAGAPEIRLVARNVDKATDLARMLAGSVRVFPAQEAASAFHGALSVINATPMGQGGVEGPTAPLFALGAEAVVMDMVYRPLHTALLVEAMARGLVAVDGLAMLIHQAVPSFEAFFGRPPPPMNIRARVLAALDAGLAREDEKP